MGTALAAVAYTLLFEVDRDRAPVETPEFLPGFAAAKVDSIQIQFQGTNILTVAREQARWNLLEPIRYPAMAEGPEFLLNIIAKLQPVGYVAEDEINLTESGLDPPRAVLRLGRSTENGGNAELHLGSLTPMEESVYARVPSRPGVFVLPKDFMRAVPRFANFWRNPDLVIIGEQWLDADTISIRSGTRRMVLQHQATNRTWQVTQPAPAKLGDKERIEQMLVNLRNWQVIQFVTDNPKADLQPFGLHSPVAELALGIGTNRLATIQFGNSPTNQPGFVFARILNHTNIVVTAKPLLDDLRSDPWEFCDHRLAQPIGPSEFERIEVAAADRFALAQSTNGVWRLAAPTSLPADQDLVMNLLRNLMTTEATELKRELVADFSEFGLAEPSAQYTLRTRGGTNRIQTQLTFGANASPAGDQLFVRRADIDSVYVVDAAMRQRLPSYAYELRDRALWSFRPTEVTKVTVVDGDKTTTLQRNNAGQWTRPGRNLNATEISQIEIAIGMLGRLKAVDWTTRGQDKLAAYDIIAKKKSLMLELVRGDQAVTRKIQFGRNSPRQHVYAFATDPLGQEPVVFEFPGNAFQGCELGLFSLAMEPPPKK